jgi:ABC-type polysaccharide/polyol phosphate transport system ATPase subunit
MTILEEQILHSDSSQDEEVVIDLRGVGKKYIVHHEKPTLAEDVERRLRFQPREEYWALQGVDLQIRKGEKVGFYGPNGVGKTTLLKMIAGICTPTKGKVSTKGRIVSLIDLEAGFHPDLTGQENIFLNGLVVGMSRAEIEVKFAQIVDFAGIGDFITAPLYTYSSGMKLRLGFSVAVHAEPEILLLDEVVNMGDDDFQRKSQQRMGEMFEQELTVVMVSHIAYFLKKNCSKIITLKKN